MDKSIPRDNGGHARFWWDLNGDHTWAVVYDGDEVVAKFCDDDAASEYVAWRNYLLT